MRNDIRKIVVWFKVYLHGYLYYNAYNSLLYTHIYINIHLPYVIHSLNHLNIRLYHNTFFYYKRRVYIQT